jgi:hypothetical protein
MTDPTVFILSSALGLLAVFVGVLVGVFGVLTPWAYPRNVLGLQDLVVDWLGWLPGVNDDLLRFETTLATVLVLLAGYALVRGGLALVPFL